MDEDALHRMYSSRIYVEGVRIDGNKRTRSAVIEQQLQDAYAAQTFEDLVDALNVAQSRLQRLGIFKSLQILVDTSGDSRVSMVGADRVEHVELHIQCREKDICAMNAGAYVRGRGASSEVSGKFRNPFGLAETFELRFGISTDQSNTFRTALQLPRPFNADGTVGCSLFQAVDSFKDSSSYLESSSGGNLWFQTLKGSTNHKFCYNSVWREVSPAVDTNGKLPYESSAASVRVMRALADQSVKSSISHTIRCDGRNDAQSPTSGYMAQFKTELAGIGGDANFVKCSTKIEWLASMPGFLGERLGLVFQVNAEAGALCPFGSDRQFARGKLGTRVCDRFFLGGPSRFPGFDIRGAAGESGKRLAPQLRERDDSEEPRLTSPKRTDGLGGDVMGVLSGMLHAPLPGVAMRELGLRVGVHATVGHLVCWEFGESGALPLSNAWRRLIENPRLSAGVCLLMPTPFGKVKLSWSRVLRFEDGDALSPWQFGFGGVSA